LKAVDSQGKAIYWSERENSWMRPMEIKTDNIENPNSFSWGKINRAIEAALLNPDLNKPFPDEAVKNFKPWIFLPQKGENNTAHAFLAPGHPSAIRWALDGNGKPVFFTTTTPDGVVHESILVQLLNPKDPKNPKADETIFALADSGMWGTPEQGYPGNFRNGFIQEFMKNQDFLKTTLPLIELAQRGGYFSKVPFLFLRPTLDSLLAQPGNNFDVLSVLGYDTQSILQGVIDGTIPSNSPFGLDKSVLIQKLLEIQNKLLPLSFASK
jgi:hypothetical protein